MLTNLLKVASTSHQRQGVDEVANFQFLVHAASLKNYVFSPKLVHANWHFCFC